MVVQACNPSHIGVEMGGSGFEASISKKVSEIPPEKTSQSQVQWLKPLILVTWEAETQKIVVQGQLGQKKFERPNLNRKSWE
jgi:hypothetical protein